MMDKLVDTHMFGESLWPRAAVPWAPSPSTSPSPTIFRPERTRETIGEMVFAEPADHLLLGVSSARGPWPWWIPAASGWSTAGPSWRWPRCR